MRNTLLEHINQESNKKYEPTYKLKEKLEKEGISTDICYCNSCKNTDIKIHHIHSIKHKTLCLIDKIIDYDIHYNFII